MSGGGKADLSGLSAEQLQAAVQSITANPAFARILGEMRGKTEGDTPPEVPPITPEMMAKLPQMMAALAPLVGKGSEGEAEKNGEKKSDVSDAEKRKKLLHALKPYLSENRRDAVDGIMRMTELTDLLSTMKPPGSSA